MSIENKNSSDLLAGQLTSEQISVDIEIQQLFKQPDLLKQALTHRSYSFETSLPDNERFEFLGDAVLDLALSHLLLKRFPSDTEGNLSKKRASLVNSESLARLARIIGLDKLILVGKGERQSGGVLKTRILSGALEAVIGALFLDLGYDFVEEKLIRPLFALALEEFSTHAPAYVSDYKTRLQEWTQSRERERRLTPTYRLDSETGPDHNKVFVVSVCLGDEVLAQGQGSSKKAAEQEAARCALELAEAKAAESAAADSAGVVVDVKSGESGEDSNEGK